MYTVWLVSMYVYMHVHVHVHDFSTSTSKNLHALIIHAQFLHVHVCVRVCAWRVQICARSVSTVLCVSIIIIFMHVHVVVYTYIVHILVHVCAQNQMGVYLKNIIIYESCTMLKALGHVIRPIATKFSTVGSKLTARTRSKYTEARVLPQINTVYYVIATDSCRVLKTSR